MSTGDAEPEGSRWSGWLVPGAALLVAMALLIFTVMPRDAPTPSPSAPRPSPTPADEHEVVTDQGVVSFRFEGNEIVVRLATGGSTTELGRATLPFISSAPPSGTPAPAGTALFVMVCGPADGPGARRYVFGHLDAGLDARYAGPEAVGHGASDGLFLFALLPGATAGPGTVKAGRGEAGFPADVFPSVATDGQKQPSGCFVL